MHWTVLLFTVGAVALGAQEHGSGMCALYGTCGKGTKFGGELPCPASVPAQPLQDAAARQTLADLCPDLADGPVCCTADQLSQLEGELKRAEPVLASCPACRRNFFDVFCQFTCSPDQSTFLEVVSNRTTLDGRTGVGELNYWLDPALADRIYDSCANVQFSATNGRAMDLVGGGAHNADELFKFVGAERPGIGSPFQLNFPWSPPTIPGMSPQNSSTGWDCGSGPLKCSCVDCDDACPRAPSFPGPRDSHWGSWLLVGWIALTLAGAAVWKRRQPSTAILEIQRLIDDDEVGDDDPFAPPAPVVLEPYEPNAWLQRVLGRWAAFCARFPGVVMALGVLAALVCSLGLTTVELDTQPESLWVGPHTSAALQKHTFDNSFGPFYRTAQIYVVNDTGPVLPADSGQQTLQWLASIESRVKSLRTDILSDSLDSFCFNPTGACVVESVTQYFPTDRNKPREAPRIDKNWASRLKQCTASPVRCLPKFGQPIDPNTVLGPGNLSETQALVTTWVLRNDIDSVFRSRVEQWEAAVERLFKDIQQFEAPQRGLRLSFSVESSLDRELGRASTTDVAVVLASYGLMFAYVTLMLHRPILGLVGILVVILNVAAAVGVCALAGLRLTLVVTEVIPFLALAIGVDNIFLVVHQLQLVAELAPHLDAVEQVAKAVGSVGPSIVLSTACEAAALAVAANVSTPAVRNFAIFAAVSVVTNSLLQLSVFIGAVALLWKPRSYPDDTIEHTEPNDPGDPLREIRRFSFISTDYTPLILRRGIKHAILAAFAAWVAISLALVPHMELGLDQRQAVPRDSFLDSYFADVAKYLGVGPPVYFVVELPHAETRQGQLELCSRFAPCDPESVPNLIDQARRHPESWLVGSPASWLDDFFQWLNPDLDRCCVDPVTRKACYAQSPWDWDMTGFPEYGNFTRLLDQWLDADTSAVCPLGGRAAYSSALSRSAGDGIVRAVHYRTSHAPLRTQSDFINAQAAATILSADIQRKTGRPTFAYSVFYPYFAQYQTITGDSLKLIGTALGLTWLLATLLLGSVRTAAVVAVVVATMVLNIAGLMVVFDISLNALSVVNLVICVGLGIEFCIHIARAFTFVPRAPPLGLRGATRADRAYNALAGTGGAVFGGIAVTKFLGVSVLAFAPSKIFVVYYFRQWLALVICATLHSLALLPVVLSFWGGRAWLLEDGGSDVFADLEEL